MKLKPGLVAFYALGSGNESGLFSCWRGPYRTETEWFWSKKNVLDEEWKLLANAVCWQWPSAAADDSWFLHELSNESAVLDNWSSNCEAASLLACFFVRAHAEHSHTRFLYVSKII